MVTAQIEVEVAIAWLLRDASKLLKKSYGEILDDLIATTGGNLPELKWVIREGPANRVKINLSESAKSYLAHSGSNFPPLSRGGLIEYLLVSHLFEVPSSDSLVYRHPGSQVEIPTIMEGEPEHSIYRIWSKYNERNRRRGIVPSGFNMSALKKTLSPDRFAPLKPKNSGMGFLDDHELHPKVFRENARPPESDEEFHFQAWMEHEGFHLNEDGDVVDEDENRVMNDAGEIL